MKMETSLKECLMDFYLNKSGVFCIIPWVHMYTGPDGRVLPCCYAKPDQPIGYLDKGLKVVWNNDAYKIFRQKMLKNIPIPEYCYKCYENEKSGNFSYRRFANEKFGKHLYEALDKTDADGTYNEFTLRYLDFRFSNLCNHRCRSCCHGLSSKWYDEQVKIHGDPGLPKVIKPNNLAYLEEVLEILPSVEAVYFAGGEPMLQEEHYLILSKLKEIGKTDVDLFYNTNLSTLGMNGYDIFDLWRGFKSLRIGASLDGSGGRGELLRKGQNWDVVVRNRKKLLENPPEVGCFDFGVSATVGAMNVLHIPDFHREWIDAGFIPPNAFLINPIFDPIYLRVNILPREYKDQVQKKYETFMREYLSDYEEIYLKYESFLKFMWESDLQDQLPTYFWWTKTLDESRGENFVQVFPEWKELFEEYGGKDTVKESGSLIMT
jgi:MoaA/NifB/PqqE/SkfB family radical SAM enzyme